MIGPSTNGGVFPRVVIRARRAMVAPWSYRYLKVARHPHRVARRSASRRCSLAADWFVCHPHPRPTSDLLPTSFRYFRVAPLSSSNVLGRPSYRSPWDFRWRGAKQDTSGMTSP